MPTFRELRQRGHSYRNFEPHEVMEMMAESNRAKGREFFQFMESGRYAEMLEKTHSMAFRLDGDELETFWRRNPDLMRWVAVWATAERLNPLLLHKPDDLDLFPEGDAPRPKEIG